MKSSRNTRNLKKNASFERFLYLEKIANVETSRRAFPRLVMRSVRPFEIFCEILYWFCRY